MSESQHRNTDAVGTAPVTQTWKAYWEAHSEELLGESPAYLAQSVVRELQPAKGMRIVEAGGGTGGLSRELARRGAKVTLLDIVPACVQSAVTRSDTPLRGIVGDLFRMPFPDATFDAVFNSGVMEHFEPRDLSDGLAEMTRVLKPGGRLLCIVPSAKGRFYVPGKRALERQGKWEYGTEYPQTSLAELVPRGELIAVHERLIGVRWQTRFLRGWRARLARLLTSPFGESSPLGSVLFGGYLLVSSWRKVGDDV